VAVNLYWSAGQTINGVDKNANENEWGEFLHLPGEKFYDFNNIRAEIVKDTEAKTGKNAGKSIWAHWLQRINYCLS
jgi:hypothetical protein